MSSTVDKNRESFTANPDDRRAFEALEEHLFLAGEWTALTDLYRQRLAAPSLAEDAPARAWLLFRLGQVLEERCRDIEGAIEHYWQVARLDPGNRLALRQLRQIHAAREQWDMVLQISEIEGGLEMQPYERASFFAEMGEIWRANMGDVEQALLCFESALEHDATQQSALAGKARCLESLERPAEAAESWTALVELQRGPDRAPSLVALAKLMAGPLQQTDGAAELYRRALTDDPRNVDAVEALVALASAREQWTLLADLFERRFDLASGAVRRTAIAVEAGQLHLERLDDPQVARMWFNRGVELCPDDLAVHHAIAELERRAGNADALLESLERIVAISQGTVPASLLLEVADLHGQHGDDQRALPFLQHARERAPSDIIVLEALSDSLQRLGRHQELADVLEQRAALADNDAVARADAFEELGRLYDEQMGDSESAIEAFAGAFACEPSRPGLATTLERLYRKAEAWSDLRGLLEIAAAQGPESERGALCCSLGEILAERFEEHEGAVRAFESALAADANDQRALTGMAQLAADAGDEELLLRACEREAEVTSDRDRLRSLVAELDRLLCERERPADALAWVTRLAQAEPEAIAVWRRAAELHEQLGEDTQLIGVLERVDALCTGAEQAKTRLRLAGLHDASGDADAALLCFEGAAESDPSSLPALEALLSRYGQARRLEDLARTQRRMADLLPPAERAVCLQELAVLLEEQLGDVEGAIVVLWKLAETPERPSDTEERLEALLERAGRFEELAQHLLEQSRTLDPASPEARRLDLRRAELLLRQLGQVEEAASTYRSLRERDPESQEVADGLEQALRAGSDPLALADYLDERADEEADPLLCARRQLECAVLREESGGDSDAALEAYRKLADTAEDPSLRDEADERLERLLERTGAWPELRQRLERMLGKHDSIRELEIRERLATLCRDRLGEREPCIEHLEAAGALAPQRPDIWRSLAILYLECDRPRDLLRVLEAELATGPDPERELLLELRIASLLIERGDTAGACRHNERVLVLDPGHSEASEFLVDHYEATGRFDEMVRLLETRLRAADDSEPERCTSLRLRIGSLYSDSLGDVDAAIETLEPALEAFGATPELAGPLSDLYQLSGRRADLISLCRNASRVCDEPAERADWMLRLGDALREEAGPNEIAEAVEAYRAVLSERPRDPAAGSALRGLYRQTGASEPLARLLEVELERADGANALPLRVELAELLEGPLARPAEALVCWRAVVDADRDNHAAFERALDLAGRLEQHSDLLALLDTRLADPASRDEAPALLERRADLLAGPLEQPGDAVASYRECVALDPGRRSASQSLRRVLEGLGSWTAVLDCLYVEAGSANSAARAAIFEQAVDVASEHLSADATLPWLERLRVERPGDAVVVSRIGQVHRQAGRPEALLRALEDELALSPDAERMREVHLDRARILERELESPGRAIAALEMAREVTPSDSEILSELDRLYTQNGWARERLEILEARIDCGGYVEPVERLDWHRTAATVAAAILADPHRALPHRLHAVALSRERGVCEARVRRELLHELAETLRATGRMDLWARAGEAELEILPSDEEGIRRELELRRELAWTYERVLANPDGARDHLGAILERAGSHPDWLSPRHVDQVEAALLERLRGDRNHVELARRLAMALRRRAALETSDASTDGDADEWLELARLRDEKLHAPTAAARAYREVLARRSDDLAAIRGLRDVSERLVDWPTVCEMLEWELELERTNAPEERGALLRRLGELRWHRLDDEELALAAFANALSEDDSDLIALRALQRLHERRGEVVQTVDLLRREIEVLGSGEDDRRMQAWLHIGEAARDHLGDRVAALDAYESAANVGALQPERQREWASLYREAGDQERFVEVFAVWCDHPDTVPDVRSADHLELAQALETLGRTDVARERTQRAIELDAGSAVAWDTLANLHEQGEDATGAADALEHAAHLIGGSDGTRRLVRAALGIEESDRERAARLLANAAEMDPGCAEVAAHRARVTSQLERWEEAEQAAARALDLRPADRDGALDHDLQVEAAIHGGTAARQRGRLEAAARFFGQAAELDSERVDALEAAGEVLFELGDLEGARKALERRLALGEANDGGRRGHHLAMVGSALAAAGEVDAALDHFERALEADPRQSEAHAGRTRLLRCGDSGEDAVAAFEAWANVCEDPAEKAQRLTSAAEIERDAAHDDDAEIHWREAIEIAPSAEPAWLGLTERLAQLGRDQDALDAATQALVHVQEPSARARLAWVRAEVLDNRGDATEAAKSYGEVVANDRRHIAAALAQARLQRGRGDWNEAAATLQDFADRYPDPGDRALSRIFHERGRLMAGPLEDMGQAVECYERAVALDPSLVEAREPLARLLAHLPERWRDATEHHRELLADDPTRASSLRSLVDIARQRDAASSRDGGLSLLRALGIASPEERLEAPATLAFPVGGGLAMERALCENLRLATVDVQKELSEVFSAESDVESDDTGNHLPFPDRFGAARRAAEQALSAPGVGDLSNDELAEMLWALAALGLDPNAVRDRDGLVASLDRGIGRWSRRKLRKTLEGVSLGEVGAIDPARWRQALADLATRAALDATGGDLRGALLVLAGEAQEAENADADTSENDTSEPGETEDIRALIQSRPAALRLLAAVVDRWCRNLEQV